MSITNASPELEAKLKKASKKDPFEVVVTQYVAYCEGHPFVNIEEK